MNVQERIHYLRKSLLNMTQEDFAGKINISRSNFANIEKGNINLTERVINDICRAFSVNRDWLMSGSEPIFNDSSDAMVSKIVELYEQLNDDNRKYLQGYIHRLLEEQHSAEIRK